MKDIKHNEYHFQKTGVKAQIKPVMELDIMKDLYEMTGKEKDDGMDFLRIKAGLVYQGLNEDGEPEWIGSQKEWREFKDLSDDMVNWSCDTDRGVQTFNSVR